MKYFSTFSGVEGIGQGLGKNWTPIGFSEIDKFASMVLNYHYPKVKNYGDITKINWNKIPDFDLLTGGSPCQDFSIAGKRRGLAGARSSLAWEFIRGLRAKKPRYFIWENVKGVLSSRNGWDFANLITAFSESGYSLWWQVLNAKDFGVPQNRERIFVIGFREESPKEIFFEREGGKEFNDLQRETEEQRDGLFSEHTNEGRDKSGAENRRGGEGRPSIFQLNSPKHSNDRIYDPAGISPALNTMEGGHRQPFIVDPQGRKNKKLSFKKESPTLRANSHGNQPIVFASRGRYKGDKTEQRVEIREDGITNTLTSVEKDNYIIQKARGNNRGGNHKISPTISSNSWEDNNHLFQENKIRKLMPIECERLMGWSDNWTKFGRTTTGEIIEISDSQRYKMCGNGVVSSVVRTISAELLK